jgi:nickel-type superoxide dismutase maturation protease
MSARGRADTLRTRDPSRALVASPYTRSPRHRRPETPRSHLRAIATLVGAAARLRLTRYEIAEHSMEPTLRPGDWTLGVRRPARIGVGDIVVAVHPDRPGFHIVKRVAGVAAGGYRVAGDHSVDSTDSRQFGPVPADAVVARLLVVYHPRPRRFL